MFTPIETILEHFRWRGEIWFYNFFNHNKKKNPFLGLEFFFIWDNTNYKHSSYKLCYTLKIAKKNKNNLTENHEKKKSSGFPINLETLTHPNLFKGCHFSLHCTPGIPNSILNFPAISSLCHFCHADLKVSLIQVWNLARTKVSIIGHNDKITNCKGAFIFLSLNKCTIINLFKYKAPISAVGRIEPGNLHNKKR